MTCYRQRKHGQWPRQRRRPQQHQYPLTAGKTLTIESGGDTTLKGAVVTGKQEVATVGGNLNLESLQDTSVYDSKQQNIGGSVTVG